MARTKFDLDWKDGDESSGEIVVGILQEELERLEAFAKLHRGKNNDGIKGVSRYEWAMLWQYYDALYNAISYAVKRDAM